MTNNEESTNIPSIIPTISLCTGYSGIEIGIGKVLENIRCVAMVERETFLCSLLLSKMEEGLLEPCPLFSDVNTFPWEEFRPIMGEGILTFGWPCQPVSSIGKREGVKDERWLFDIISDGVEIMQPGWLFAENVEGLLSAKMPGGGLVIGHCIERLEELDYTVEVGIFSAEEVFAPHRRKRVWLLAHRKGVKCEWAITERDKLRESKEEIGSGSFLSNEWPSRPRDAQNEWEEPRVVLAHPKSRKSGKQKKKQGGEDSQSGSEKMVNPSSQRSCGNLQTEGCDPEEGSGIKGEKRSPESELGGEPNAEQVRQVGDSLFNVDPTIRRLERLKALGNGVIPDCAAKAFVFLFNRLAEREQ
jgi:site-specific DNA-cytosine methylase